LFLQLFKQGEACHILVTIAPLLSRIELHC
jgi:hypothetical protein